MKRYLLILISFFMIFAAPLIAKTLPKGTKIYKETDLNSKVVYVCKKRTKVAARKIRTRGWILVKGKSFKGFVYIGSGGNSGGNSETPKGTHKASSKSKRGKNNSMLGKPGSRRNKASNKATSLQPRPRKRSGQKMESGINKSNSTFSKPRPMTRAEKLKAEHDAAQARALKNNEDFCSQCWYASRGVDVERGDDTLPKFDKEGTLTLEGQSPSSGKKVFE